MNKIGIYLGGEPHTGGLSQYAKALLDSMRLMEKQGYQIVVAYISEKWQPVLEGYSFSSKKLVAGRLGGLIADAFMALRLPGELTRFLSGLLNPIPCQLSNLDCKLWIFPTQDAMTWQTKEQVVGTIHDLMHRYEPNFPEVSDNGRLKIRDHRFNSIATYSKAILVDSKMGRSHVVECYKVSPNKIYPLPYIPPPHSLLESVSSSFDENYVLPKKFIFYPAQFWAHKNHKRLISAAVKLKPVYPDIALVFTGAKKYDYEAIFEHASKLDFLENITFSEHIPDEDLVGFYRRARAMIMPTFFGPTNIPPLEAMANRCPVAVSKIYGMPEQLGDAALYFDPNDIDEMSEVMEKLWVDDQLCLSLISKGELKTKKWGQKQFTEKFCDILMQVLNSPKNKP